MKEHPIIFSAPMVRALLAGAKTQTRRIVKPQPGLDPAAKGELWRWPPGEDWKTAWRGGFSDLMADRCPYGKRGDRLWVRETWCRAHPEYHNERDRPGDRPEGPGGEWCFYRASDPDVESGDRPEGSPWKPSIHMPRWASRITLEVTGVRVERVQDISEADARAEGVRPFFEVYDQIGRDQRITSGELARDAEHRASYACLWDEINGDKAGGRWFDNPWAWVVEFRLVTKP